MSVSQPSTGHVRVLMPVTSREPIEPWLARRHKVGVVAGEMSLQRRPPMPATMTCGDLGAPGLARPACPAVGAARASVPAAVASTLPRIGCTRSTVSAAWLLAGWAGLAAAWRSRRQRR